MRFDIYNINEEPKKEEPVVLVQPIVNEPELKKEESIVSVQPQSTVIPKVEEPKKDINLCLDCPKNANCEFKPKEEIMHNKKVTMIATFCKWKDGKDYIEPDKK